MQTTKTWMMWREVNLLKEQSTFILKKQWRKTKHSEIEPPSKVVLLEPEVTAINT